MKKFYVDRIEEEIVVCVDRKKNLIKINLNEIIGKVREGSVLIKKDGRFVVDELETKLIRDLNISLQNELFFDEK